MYILIFSAFHSFVHFFSLFQSMKWKLIPMRCILIVYVFFSICRIPPNGFIKKRGAKKKIRENWDTEKGRPKERVFKMKCTAEIETIPSFFYVSRNIKTDLIFKLQRLLAHHHHYYHCRVFSITLSTSTGFVGLGTIMTWRGIINKYQIYIFNT